MRQFELFGINDRLKAIEAELKELRGDDKGMLVGYERRSRQGALRRERRELQERLRKHREETK